MFKRRETYLVMLKRRETHLVVRRVKQWRWTPRCHDNLDKLRVLIFNKVNDRLSGVDDRMRLDWLPTWRGHCPGKPEDQVDVPRNRFTAASTVVYIIRPIACPFSCHTPGNSLIHAIPLIFATQGRTYRFYCDYLKMRCNNCVSLRGKGRESPCTIYGCRQKRETRPLKQ